MLRDLDAIRFSIVEDISRDILRNTFGTITLPVDVEVIAKTYNIFNDGLEDLSKLPEARKEHRFFELSMKIIEHEYMLQYNEALEKVYVSLGARYLMMPEKGFRRNILEYNYNLFDLKKEIYTNVPLEPLAYHMADIAHCAVFKWQEERFVRIFVNHDMDESYLRNIRRCTGKVMGVMEKNFKGQYEEEFGYLKVMGWRINMNNIMVVCLQNDCVCLSR
jgi:hypothetical protein